MSTKTTGLKMAAGRPSRAKAGTIPANVFDEKAKMVRVNFDLTKDEHTKLKVYAAKTGRSISEILREFVTQLSD